jgi:hypothetical protein
MNRSLALFLGIVILGVVLVTFFYRAIAVAPPPPDAGTVVALSDAQKLLFETQSSLSKWLLGLAYAALAGLFGFRIKSPEDSERFREHFPLVACALLVISLYGGFLFQQASILVLIHGPSDLLFGDGILLTLQVQFWFLTFGFVVLGAWLFRGPGKSVRVAAGLIIGLLAACPLTAGEDRPSPLRSCVNGWQEDRGVSLGPERVGEAVKLVEELASREKVNLQEADLCPFTASVLDELRFSIIQYGNDAKVAEKMAVIVSSTQRDLTNPNFAPGSLVQKLVRLSQIWRSPSGLLLVLAREGRFEIFLSGEMVGVTNWTRRLEPGTYTLWFTRDGLRRREYDRQVRIGDGELVRVEVGGTGK